MIVDKIITKIPSSLRRFFGRVSFSRYLRDVFYYAELIPVFRPSHYSGILERIRKKARSGQKINVTFIVSQNQKWSAQSVFNEIAGDEKYHAKVLLAFPGDAPERVYNEKDIIFFEKNCIEAVKAYDGKEQKYRDIIEGEIDVAFIEQPWIDMDIIKKVSRIALICYIPYGITMAKTPGAQFNHILHNLSWKIFCETDFHKELFRKYGFRKGANAVVSGYPKLDVYLDRHRDIRCSLWKNASARKRIIWAPHHSLDKNDLVCYSTFDKNYRFFYDYARANPDIDWVIKPHPKLAQQVEATGLMTRKEYRQYMDEMGSLGNVSYFDEGNYFDLFMTSDALITDSISFLAEYLPTKKPILFLDRPGNTGFNEYGVKIVENYYKAYENPDIQEFIKDVVLEGNDRLFEKRMKTLETYLYFPEGKSAGKFIKHFLDKVFAG